MLYSNHAQRSNELGAADDDTARSPITVITNKDSDDIVDELIAQANSEHVFNRAGSNWISIVAPQPDVRLASNSVLPSTATEFPKFLQLPAELQLDIWRRAAAWRPTISIRDAISSTSAFRNTSDRLELNRMLYRKGDVIIAGVLPSLFAVSIDARQQAFTEMNGATLYVEDLSALAKLIQMRTEPRMGFKAYGIKTLAFRYYRGDYSSELNTADLLFCAVRCFATIEEIILVRPRYLSPPHYFVDDLDEFERKQAKGIEIFERMGHVVPFKTPRFLSLKDTEFRTRIGINA